MQSIERAKTMVRSIRAPVTVYLRAGTCYFSKAVAFKSADARDVNAIMIYRPYKRVVVTIYGAVTLKLKWTRAGSIEGVGSNPSLTVEKHAKQIKTR